MVAHGVMRSAVRRLLAFMVSFLVVTGTFAPVAVAASGVNGQGSFTVGVKREALAEGSTGKLDVSLLYGDKKDHPDGMGYYTHDTMAGFIKLEPSNLTANLKDVIVRLAVPKEHVEAGTVDIAAFTTNSPVTKYRGISKSEDDTNYYVDIDFEAYDQTQTIALPFSLSFKDDVVPVDYELPVSASVIYSDGSSNGSDPIVYKPTYKAWGIDKFVNTNRITAFKIDGVEAVMASKDEKGNPYLDDRTYVDFYFEVNNVGGDNAQDNYRDTTEVTLTDTLPSYTKKDGTVGTAVFDADVNPGWMLGGDGKTVSKTYTGKDTGDVLMKIYKDESLKLRFPDIRMDKTEGNGWSASVTNEVSLRAVPTGKSDGEPDLVASDSLRFLISTDPTTFGSFRKSAMDGNIYDLDEYKENSYSWSLCLSNDGARPLENIEIQDRKIVNEGTGRVDLAGLDPALKFVRLESNMDGSVLADGKTVADMVDHVVAYYTSDPSGALSDFHEDIPVAVDGSGNFVVEFPKDKICNGYDIIFKKDAKVLTGEAVSFTVYTQYRDPKDRMVPIGQERVRYENTARAVNSYVNDGKWTWKFIWSTSGYDMLSTSEELRIGKRLPGGSSKELRPGGVYRYWISLSGALEKEKDYGKIRIIDLLPNEVDFQEVANGKDFFADRSGTPEIIENYHNSGKTALIWTVSEEMLRAHLDNPKTNNLYYARFQVEVKIREDAHTGTIRNDIYIVGDNLGEYASNTGGTEDTWDLNDNGRTDDRIAYASCDASIVGVASVYGEKSIALAGTDDWNRQGLSLAAGTNFDYRLKVVNELEKDFGLVVYDVLPEIGDQNVFATSGRGSEFQVRLREAIAPPDGYMVHYTESRDVYEKPMSEMSGAENVWIEASEVTDWSAVTAFKLEAAPDTPLLENVPFEVRVPARIASLSGSSGLVDVEAVNSFGFHTRNGIAVKESNPVWVRLSFAGFEVRKTDSVDGRGLGGAVFTLSKSDDETFEAMTATSGEDGLLEFRGLEVGEYTLTETEAPVGYIGGGMPLRVTITRDPSTMEYAVEISGIEGSGTGADPFLVENTASGFELPKTGGAGTGPYITLGSAMALLSVLLLIDRKGCHGRRRR